MVLHSRRLDTQTRRLANECVLTAPVNNAVLKAVKPQNKKGLTETMVFPSGVCFTLNSTSFSAVTSATVTYNSPMQVTSRAARFLEFMSIVSSNLYTAPCLAFSQIANFSASDFASSTIAATELEFLTAKFTSLLSVSSETILTTELRVSKEPHSGPVPSQLLNKSEAEKHHKTNDCSFQSSFIGMLTISSDSHDNALFCLPLFFVRVPAISAFGGPLFGLLGRRCSYSGLSPSASNCRLHSVGGSRSRSTPMPRGRRPSTAALTRFGARKASEMVMLPLAAFFADAKFCDGG